MRVLASWDELYPALFLVIEGDDDIDTYEHEQLYQYGAEVPDELAERWRATRDAWFALGKEIAAHLGREKP